MARLDEIGAHSITFPDRLGKKVMLHMYISKEDSLSINGVKIDLPDEVYNVTFED